MIGVKDSRASAGSLLHLFLLGAVSVSLAVDVNAYVYIIRDLACTWLFSDTLQMAIYVFESI